MLRISRIADYGVVLGTRLAVLREEGLRGQGLRGDGLRGDGLGGDELRSTVELAADTGIPQPTVSKILKQLVREGLVASERGARGGYRLAGRPEDISVAAIISALEGPIGVTECGVDGEDVDHQDCELSGHCDVRGTWQLINQAILRALEGITLAEMAAPGAGVLVSLGKKGSDSFKLHVNER